MGATSRRDLHGDWKLRQHRAAVVRAHVAEHGMVCPGWQRAPHPSLDLTADHVVAVAGGGAPDGPMAVLCRSCNGRKGKQGHEQVLIPPVRSRDWLAS